MTDRWEEVNGSEQTPADGARPSQGEMVQLNPVAGPLQAYPSSPLPAPP